MTISFFQYDTFLHSISVFGMYWVPVPIPTTRHQKIHSVLRTYLGPDLQGRCEAIHRLIIVTGEIEQHTQTNLKKWRNWKNQFKSSSRGQIMWNFNFLKYLHYYVKKGVMLPENLIQVSLHTEEKKFQNSKFSKIALERLNNTPKPTWKNGEIEKISSSLVQEGK